MFGRRSNDPAAPRRALPAQEAVPAKVADSRPVAAEPVRVPVKQEAPAPERRASSSR